MIIAETVYGTDDSGQKYLVAHEGTRIDARVFTHLQEYHVEFVEVLSMSPPTPDDLKKPVVFIPTLQAMPNPEPEPPPPPPPEPEPEPEIILPPEPLKPVFNVHTDAPPVKSIIGDNLRKEATESIQQLFTLFTDPGDSANRTTAYHALSGFETVLEQVVEAVTHDPTGLIHIHDLKSYDEYTYHHSLSVAMLAVATGQTLGLLHSDLIKLSRCAMLHDIGKQIIPVEIINKPSALTVSEFETMKMHPTNGAAILKAKAIGDTELWSGIMFHHEKYNGTGYPKGLKGDKIPLFSRIITVADVYDAVTSFRTYRNPMTPALAYEVVCAEVGISFDYDVVKAFTDRLELYPISTAIELSDGRIGIVIDNEAATRPVLKIWGTGETVDLAHPRNLTLLISRIIHPNDAPWEQ